MTRFATVLSLAVFVCAAAPAQPEAVTIEHKAVGCIVAGQYPRVDACFTPAANLARSRVYFRPQGDPTWYYVDMKADQSCFSGTLPRPGKKLVGKKIEYYVDAQDKAFVPARTAQFEPMVVKAARDCDKDKPVAPFVNNATVAVFPTLPAGFVGTGLASGAVIGIAAAGAAVVGTTAIAAGGGDDKPSTTTPPVGSSPTTTLATPVPNTTTTLPPTGNLAPFAVLTTSPNPPSGTGPLTVTFDLCKSTDPNVDRLTYFYDFGDGAKASGSCLESHTYGSSSVRGASGVRALDASFEMQGCAVDPFGLSNCRTRSVSVGSPAPDPAPSCDTPTVRITDPQSPYVASCRSVPLTAATTNTSAVQFCQQPTKSPLCFPKVGAQDAAVPVPSCVAGTPVGDTFRATLDLPSDGCFEIVATATGCGGKATSAPVIVFAPFTVASAPGAQGCFQETSETEAGEMTAAWSSDLVLDGGRLQLVVNGSAASYPERGRSGGIARLLGRENRMEATVLDADGKAGTWTVDFSGSNAVQGGSIRVLSGDVALIGPTRVTFRLRGTPGERVSFTFVTRPR
jgi:hypothetical protein